MFKAVFVSIAILFLLTGCTPRQCGIDEKVFASLSQEKKDEICTSYSLNQQRIALARAEEARALAQKESIEAALESEKIRSIHRDYRSRIGSRDIVEITVSSATMRYKKRDLPAGGIRFSLVRGEVRKIELGCTLHEYDHIKEDIWVAYFDDMIFIDVEPSYSKRHLKAYIADGRGDFFVGSNRGFYIQREARNRFEAKFKHKSYLQQLSIEVSRSQR